jgi:hypothetical protein
MFDSTRSIADRPESQSVFESRRVSEARRYAAADFFTVEVLTMGGLVRYVVFSVLKLKTRARSNSLVSWLRHG